MICGNTYLDREKVMTISKIRKRIFPNIGEDAAFNKCYISVWQCIVHPPKARENMKE